MRDIESWEDHYNYHKNEDYPGLVKYCEADIRNYPRDLYAADRLAQAYVLNGQYEDAIRFAGTMHQENPTVRMFHRHILDALFALGKTENDFQWLVVPNIVRLTHEVREACYNALRGKRKPRSASELLHSLWSGDYVVFSDLELLEYLRCDARFVILQESSCPAEIKVAPKRKSRTKG